ncbi:MAG: IS200/IS605 family transposase, partial [Candidatus Hydrogenedentes bacterium]|nr:IS200/IS605 family transposase [Candidatus Hydrogenedentota bacterium]
KRRPWIDSEMAPRVHAYSGGVIRNLGGIALEISGAEEHIHILAKLRPDKPVSDVLRIIKSNSSGWIHDTFPDKAGFAWQEGYTAFTVSESQVERVRRYIANQAAHHRKLSFQEELVKLLKAHGIEYDERYI